MSTFKTDKISAGLVMLLLLYATAAFSQKRIYNILSFGARAGDYTPNTPFIQRAIDEASAAGGGMVLVPAGKFVTGVIYLRSNVELHLAANAALMGSTKRKDYGLGKASALIVANGQHNISITGEGMIDGQAMLLLQDLYRMLNEGTLQDAEWKTYNPWHQMRPSEDNRPKMIAFDNCDSITIKGVSLKNALDWVQDYRNCSNLVIDSVKVESNTFLNNDGIDLVDCKNAKVTHCRINADDDGICLKSEDRSRRCENIYIADCTVRSSASAIKFGTASRGGFRKITIRNIIVYDTYRSAIAIECVDGGVLEDVDIRNIKATRTGNAIFIRLGHRNKDSVVSVLRRVHIGNVKVEVPKDKPDKGYPMEGPLVDGPHNVFPSSITGLPGHPVENILLDSIEITYEGGARKETAFFNPDTLGKVPERPGDYPEFSMFGELPCWGWYVRHATGITMENIRVSFKEDDFRPACIFDDVRQLKLSNIQIPSYTEAPLIILNKVQQVSLQDLHLPIPQNKAVRIR